MRTMPRTSTGSSSFEVLGEHSTCDGETVLEFVDENTADSHKKKGDGESRQGEAEAEQHKPKSLDDVVYALHEMKVKLAEQSHFMGVCRWRGKSLAELQGANKVLDYKMDWSKLNCIMLKEIYDQLMDNDYAELSEMIPKDSVIEQFCIRAMCLDIDIRCELGSDFVIFPPSIRSSTSYSSFEKSEDDQESKAAKCRELVANTSHVFFVVWDEVALHYTHMYTRKPEQGGQRFIEFKNSMMNADATSRSAATQLLQILHLGEKCPPPSNRADTVDRWSTGLSVISWIEEKVRAIVGEPSMPPPNLKQILDRANEFIRMIKKAKHFGYKKGEAEKQGCEIVGELHAKAEEKKVEVEIKEGEPKISDDVVNECEGIKRKRTEHTQFTDYCFTKMSPTDLDRKAEEFEKAAAIEKNAHNE